MPRPERERAVTAELAELVESAARALDSATGSSAVCTFTRSGTPVPGIKYAEGRWAALREAQRRIAKGASFDDAVRVGLEEWAAALDTLRLRGANADWVAYRTGGVDALDELADPADVADSRRPGSS